MLPAESGIKAKLYLIWSKSIQEIYHLSRPSLLMSWNICEFTGVLWSVYFIQKYSDKSGEFWSKQEEGGGDSGGLKDLGILPLSLSLQNGVRDLWFKPESTFRKIFYILYWYDKKWCFIKLLHIWPPPFLSLNFLAPEGIFIEWLYRMERVRRYNDNIRTRIIFHKY